MSTDNPSLGDPSEDELFANLAGLAKTIGDADRAREAPPAHIWDAIASGVADPRSLEDNDDTVIDLTRQRTDRQRRSAPATKPARAGSSRSPLLLVAAAIIALVVIGGAVVAGITGTGEDNVVFAGEISNSEMPEPFDGTATATLEIDDDPALVIDFDQELPTDEPVELWLISADGSDIVSLGLVEAGDTEWEWPAELTPADYPLVDLSIEPDDGDPTHSGRSILRGELVSS